MSRVNIKTGIAAIVVVSTLLVTLNAAGQGRAQQPPANPPAGGTLAQRVQQRKTERAITLDKKEQARLTAQCTKVQSKLRTIQQQASRVAESRTKAYQHIDADLWIIIGQLKLAEKDTFKLEQKRSQLVQKTTAFQATGTNYRQALDDAVVINCQADTVGFKALLETTRIYYAQWRAQALDSRNFIINDIKATLNDHVKDLQSAQQPGGGN